MAGPVDARTSCLVQKQKGKALLPEMRSVRIHPMAVLAPAVTAVTARQFLIPQPVLGHNSRPCGRPGTSGSSQAPGCSEQSC